jgi:WD40 repeat protein
MESGTSCGDITGHAKPINAVSIRHQRPFRAISGSDDNSVVLHTAVPFKYDKIISSHKRFVRDVAYSPSGDSFVSCGSDGKLVFYEGKDGTVTGEVDRDGATGTLVIISLSGEVSQGVMLITL